MARVQTNDLSAAPAIKPQATPVDAFVAPNAVPNRQAPDPNNALAQLAGALSRLNPKIQQYAAEYQQNQVENAKLLSEQQKRDAVAQAGELATKNQTDWNTLTKSLEKKSQDPSLSALEQTDAQRQLQIVRGTNPWVKVLYEKNVLSQVADGVDQQMRTEWANSPIKNTDDPALLDQWSNQHTQAALNVVQGKYGNRALAEDFFPNIEKSKNALMAEHINYRQQQRVQDAKDSFSVATMSTVNKFTESYNDELGKEIDRIDAIKGLDGNQKIVELDKAKAAIYTKWATELTAKGQQSIMLGLQGKEVNTSLADSIIVVAEREKDARILKLADYVKTANDQPLSKINEVQEKLTAARRAITNESWTNIQKQDKLEERERKQFQRTADTEMFNRLSQDPYADVSDFQTEFMKRNMGDEWIDVMQTRRKLQEQHEAPIVKREDLAGVGAYVYNGGTKMAPLNKALREGKIDAATYNNYGRTVSYNSQREESNAGLASLKKEATDNAIKYAQDRYRLNVLNTGLSAPRIKSRQVEVETEVRRSLDDYVRTQEKAGHSPSRDDVNDYLYNKLFPRMDKQYEVTSKAVAPQSQPVHKPMAHQQVYSNIQKLQNASPGKTGTAQHTDARQAKIAKIKADTRLSPETKKKLIQFLGQ